MQPVRRAKRDTTSVGGKKAGNLCQGEKACHKCPAQRIATYVKKDKQRTPNSYYLDGISRFFLAH